MKYAHTDQLQAEYQQKRNAVRKRLKEFRQVPREKYFYELIYCLMTPQSSAVNAGRAQRAFEESGFRYNSVDPLPILADRRHYIRFHNTKSARITAMKLQYDEIEALLHSSVTAAEKRDWLVRHVNGISMKEATHLLRNIGMNDGLAILDRHILKNLVYHRVIRSIPKTVTAKRYLSIEGRFRRFAQAVSITVDELDLLFWSREAGKILK
jgi:N-glycosylase/DNA lyase